MKASQYFSSKLETSMESTLEGFIPETDNRAVRKSVKDAFERLRKEAVTKLNCLNAAKSGFKVDEYLNVRAKSVIQGGVVKKRAAKTIEDTSGEILNPALFNRLKEWRNVKAAELRLPHYVIMHQKTLVTIVNELPKSMSSLKMIKGMGKKKSEKYGEELLSIIESFCNEETT